MPHALLSYAHYLHKLGVPTARVVEYLDLDISKPALTKLIKLYNEVDNCVDAEQSKQIHMSLFPTWLDPWQKVQEQPADWDYVGFFPFGEWVAK